MYIFIIGIFLTALILLFYIRYLLFLFSIPQKLRTAVRLLEQDNEPEAIKILSFIVSFDRTNTQANWILANLYIKKTQYILAQMYLYDILYSNKFTKDITEVQVRETLAYLYQKTGEFNKAVIQFMLLKKHNSLSLPAVKNAIKTAIQEKSYKEAGLLLKQVKSLDTDDGEIYYLDALIDFNHSAFPAAERKMKLAMERGFRTPNSDFLLGKLYFFTRQYDQALKYFQSVEDEYLNRSELESFMGQCFYYLKDYDSTINALETFLKNIKKKESKFIANIEYILGSAYEAQGNLDTAIEIWKRISDYAPFFQPVKEKLFFYERIAKDSSIRSIISMPLDQFIKKCEHLLEKMAYIIKLKIMEEDKNLEYICISQKNTELFNLFLVHITRKSQSIDLEELNSFIIRSKRNKARYVVVIAPYFEENALIMAKQKGLTVYKYDIFK
ncbi:MAG: tetratricopeptide repeat protein [bacterium]|nr:tetratricopeptide repeat protein [bacterium]